LLFFILNSSMKFSAVKRQLLDDQVESAKSLLTYTTEIERKGELDFNPYLKSELQHLQKYVDQLSVKPKSPFSVYRRTEDEDLSYCLHRKHSKSMNSLTGLMKNINKELYRLKKLKQAEKKLEFLEIFQSFPASQQHEDENNDQIIQTVSNHQHYKLPDSKTTTFIPQLSSPKPKYDKVSFHGDEEEKKPEMSRAMESFLIQQEKERKEKEQQQPQKEIKPLAAFIPNISSSDQKALKEREEEKKSQKSKSTVILKEVPFTHSSGDKVVAESKEKTGRVDSSQKKPPLSFSGLKQSGPTYVSPHSHPYTSSDPERPYGAYNENGPYPHYISTFGRSSGATLEGQQTKSGEKSRGGFY
jgi:hypothetical protein